MKSAKNRWMLVIVMMAIAGCLFGTTDSSAATITLGSSGDWHATGTWTGGVLPGTSDKADLKGGYTVNFTAASGDQTIKDIWGMNSTLNISGDDTLRVTGNANLAWANQFTLNQSGGTFRAGTLNLLTTSNGNMTVDYALTGGSVLVDNNMVFGNMCCGAQTRRADFTISNSALLDVGNELAFVTNTYGGSLNWADPTFTVVGSTPTINVGNGLRINDQSAIPGTTTLAFQADAAGISPLNITGSVLVAETLDIDLTAYTADAGEILVIANDSTDAVAGGFSTVNITPSASGKTYAVTYGGGTGNDVSLVGSLTWDGTTNDWGTAHWHTGTSLVTPSDGLGMTVAGGTSTVVGTHAPDSLTVTGGSVPIAATGDLSVSILDIASAGGISGVAGGKLTVGSAMNVGADVDLSNLTLGLASATVNMSANLTGNASMTVDNLNVNGGAMDLGGGDLTVTNKLALTADLDMTTPGMGTLTASGPEISVVGPATLSLDNVVTPAILTLTDGATVVAGAGAGVDATDKYVLRKVTTDLDLTGPTTKLIAGVDGATKLELVVLNGTSSYGGKTEINRTVLRTSNPGPGDNLNLGTGVIEFSSNDDRGPAILETSGTIERVIGNAAGKIRWQNRGGFAAFGDDLTVTLTRDDGTTDPLDWSSGTNGFRSQNLQWGSSTATHAAELTNDIQLDGNKVIYTYDNPNAPTDVSVFSGIISEDSSARNLTKRGKGTLWLAGADNTYTGMTHVRDGNSNASSVLRAADAATGAFNLTNTARIKLEGGRLEANGNLAFDLGNTPGTVEFAGAGGGFSAWGPGGEDLTVTLNNGATIKWGDSAAAGGFAGKDLGMGSQMSNAAVFMTNDFDGGNATRNIRIENNPLSDADRTVFQGDLTNFGSLRIYALNEGSWLYEHGVVEIAGTLATTNEIQVNNHSQLWVTGTVSPGKELRVQNQSILGGTGTIELNAGQKAYINNNSFLAPGIGDVGALTVNGGEFEMQGGTTPAGATYQWEIADSGADIVHITNGTLDLRNTWNIELLDAGVLAGIDPTDQIDLFDYDQNTVLQINGTAQADGVVEITNFALASVLPDGWDTTNARLWYDQAAGLGGRIYMDGLFVQSANVPEPSTIVLLLLGLLGVWGLRRKS